MPDVADIYPGAIDAVSLCEQLDAIRVGDFPPDLRKALLEIGCQDLPFFQSMTESGVKPEGMLDVLRVFFSQPQCPAKVLLQLDHPDFLRYLAVKMGLV